jgi:hypothetical protein
MFCTAFDHASGISIRLRVACQDRPDAPTHGQPLDALGASLAWFGAEDAQVLEHWLDVSRFSGWK